MESKCGIIAGAVMRAYREDRGLGQEEAAQAMGMARPTYANLESGRRSPRPDVAKRLSAYFGFDWTMFYDKEGIVRSVERLPLEF